jgi:hypothetical protein
MFYTQLYTQIKYYKTEQDEFVITIYSLPEHPIIHDETSNAYPPLFSETPMTMASWGFFLGRLTHPVSITPTIILYIIPNDTIEHSINLPIYLLS